MPPVLNPLEIRVLGALVEKQITTPEYYPLSLNALVNACNQKTGRDPVMSLGDGNVEGVLDRLREKQLARQIIEDGARVPKYAHIFNQAYRLDRPEVAILCLLMLRGLQTVGELRGRSGRLYEFKDLAEVERTLEELTGREEGALVVRLPRQAGFKEARYAHLLAGPIKIEDYAEAAPEETPAPPLPSAPAAAETIARLEEEIGSIRQDLQALRNQFEAFMKQFE